MNDYERDLAIDPHDLGEECVQQPLLYNKFAKLRSEVMEDLENAKLDLDLVENEKEEVKIFAANLDTAIRTHPETYQVRKITEKVVEAAIITNEEYQIKLNTWLNKKEEKKRAWIKASRNAEDLNVAVKSFEQKRSALDLLIKLYLNEYYAIPNVPINTEPGKRYLKLLESKHTETDTDQVNKLNDKRKEKEDKTGVKRRGRKGAKIDE